MKVRERAIGLGLCCAGLPYTYGATASFPGFFLGKSQSFQGQSQVLNLQQRLPRSCHSGFFFDSLFIFCTLLIVCSTVGYLYLYLPPSSDPERLKRRAVFCASLYLSQCDIVPRSHIGLLSPVEFLEFDENFIHLHIDSFHSFSLSWIYFRKWPPSPCFVSAWTLRIENKL